MSSPAERFRNELSQRLCVEGNFSMPNTNILLGVIIAGMEHNLSAQHHPISETTLQNVLKVSKEIECFGRILHLKVKAIPSLTLQTLRSFSLAPDSLLAPCPKIITYLTYSAIVHRLSAYIGPQAVRELIKDFNRTVPNKKGKGKTVRKVPGVGPRIDVVKSRDRELSGRRSPVMFGREKMLDPMCSVERLADPMGSMERLVDAHPVMCSLEGAERPLVCFVRGETVGQDILVPEPRRMASRETLKDTLSVRQPRHARSWETFAPARTSAPPIFLSLPARSPDRPYPYPCRSVDGSIADSGIHMPDSPTTSTSSSASKRRSIRGLEYIRNKLGRISKIYSSEISFI